MTDTGQDNTEEAFETPAGRRAKGLSGLDLGSGRVKGLAGLDLGSGRIRATDGFERSQ